MRWPKYWSFSFSIIPSKEIPGLISLQSKGLSRVFSNTTVQKHQFGLPKSLLWSSAQFSSVSQSCPILCHPMNHSTPGLPVHHQLPEFTQTHVLRVSDAIQPSHPLSSLLLLPPIPPSIRVFFSESTLHMRWPKYWSFSFSIIPSKEIPGLISLQSKGLSRVFSNTTVQKHQFFGTQPSSQSNSHIHT